MSKLRARLLPALVEGARRLGRPPPHLTFALAALAAFYRGSELADGALVARRGDVAYRIEDEPRVLAFFLTAWRACPRGAETPARCLALARRVLARDDLWGPELAEIAGLDAAVATFLHDIVTTGARAAVGRLVEGNARAVAS